MGTKAGNQNARVLTEVAQREGVVKRSARVLRLRNELDVILEVVVQTRERLQNELKDCPQNKFIDKGFVDKLVKLSQAFERLTSSRIALGKAEKAEEAEMTPSEEIAAVESFVASMGNEERAELIRRMWEKHKSMRDPRGARGPDKLPGDEPGV